MHVFGRTSWLVTAVVSLASKTQVIPAFHAFIHLLSSASFHVISRMILVTTSASKWIFDLDARQVRPSALFGSVIFSNCFVRNSIKCHFVVCHRFYVWITWRQEETSQASWGVVMQKRGTTRKDGTEEKHTKQCVAPCAFVLTMKAVPKYYYAAQFTTNEREGNN